MLVNLFFIRSFSNARVPKDYLVWFNCLINTRLQYRKITINSFEHLVDLSMRALFTTNPNEVGVSIIDNQ